MIVCGEGSYRYLGGPRRQLESLSRLFACIHASEELIPSLIHAQRVFSPLLVHGFHHIAAQPPCKSPPTLNPDTLRIATTQERLSKHLSSERTPFLQNVADERSGYQRPIDGPNHSLVSSRTTTEALTRCFYSNIRRTSQPGPLSSEGAEHRQEPKK